jgi:hypothetical protein
VFPLHPFEALVLCNHGDLNRATYCFWARARKLNKSCGRCVVAFNKQSGKVIFRKTLTQPNWPVTPNRLF